MKFGFVIDHTGKARTLRTAYMGPTLRWPPNPKGPEQEITFAPINPAHHGPLTRETLCTSSSLTQPAPPLRVNVDLPPMNHPDYSGWLTR